MKYLGYVIAHIAYGLDCAQTWLFSGVPGYQEKTVDLYLASAFRERIRNLDDRLIDALEGEQWSQ